jgi:hypothetical protein
MRVGYNPNTRLWRIVERRECEQENTNTAPGKVSTSHCESLGDVKGLAMAF